MRCVKGFGVHESYGKIVRSIAKKLGKGLMSCVWRKLRAIGYESQDGANLTCTCTPVLCAIELRMLRNFHHLFEQGKKSCMSRSGSTHIYLHDRKGEWRDTFV